LFIKAQTWLQSNELPIVLSDYKTNKTKKHAILFMEVELNEISGEFE
jgi:hypothetical protein